MPALPDPTTHRPCFPSHPHPSCRLREVLWPTVIGQACRWPDGTRASFACPQMGLFHDLGTPLARCQVYSLPDATRQLSSVHQYSAVSFFGFALLQCNHQRTYNIHDAYGTVGCTSWVKKSNAASRCGKARACPTEVAGVYRLTLGYMTSPPWPRAVSRCCPVACLFVPSSPLIPRVTGLGRAKI